MIRIRTLCFLGLCGSVAFACSTSSERDGGDGAGGADGDADAGDSPSSGGKSGTGGRPLGDAGAENGGGGLGGGGGGPDGPCPDHDQEVFGEKTVGCQGMLTYAGRDVCGDGWHVCSSAEWRQALTDDAPAPSHHYWVDDYLYYGGEGTDSCFVSNDANFVAPSEEGGVSECGDETPMRVCATADEDPLGNFCNWTGCGWEAAAPSQYFGGCEGNDTAGTLCCSD